MSTPTAPTPTDRWGNPLPPAVAPGTTLAPTGNPGEYSTRCGWTVRGYCLTDPNRRYWAVLAPGEADGGNTDWTAYTLAEVRETFRAGFGGAS